MSEAEGGGGGIENLTYADMKFRGGGEGVRQLVMSLKFFILDKRGS